MILSGYILKPFGSQGHIVDAAVIVELVSISMGGFIALVVAWQSVWTSEAKKHSLEHVYPILVVINV